jgi:hypothetical protein
MAEAADYRILVKGAVPEDWHGRFGELRVTVEKQNGDCVTLLEGRLRDRAALSGVLNTLYELHHSVLSIERLEEDED